MPTGIKVGEQDNDRRDMPDHIVNVYYFHYNLKIVVLHIPVFAVIQCVYSIRSCL